MKRLFLALSLAFAAFSPVLAEDNAEKNPAATDPAPALVPPVPPVPSELVIGQIRVLRSNVFAPVGDQPLHFPYSWGNKLHIVTQEEFIREELTFKEGDPFDPERLRESERLLRSRPIFRYVRVEALPAQDGRVDVVVTTEDVWTTSIRLAYGTAGGENFYTFGFLENNFLGQGKVVGAFVEQDIDRLTRGVSYRDRHLLGSRWELFGGYGQDEKGRDWEASLVRPFYSSRVPYSEGGQIFVSDDEDRLFLGGEEVVKFAHEKEDHRVFGAFAIDPRPDSVRRFTLAYERQADRFDDVRFRVPPPVFEDRTVAAALIGFDYRNLRYEKFRGILTFDRDEDVNLGWEWMFEAGPSLEAFGATRDGALGRFQAQKIFSSRRGHVWFNHLDLDGRLESRTVRDGVMRLRSEYFWPEWIEKNTVSLRGEWTASHNLDPETQFLLGGENGLRGYSVRQFSGENSLLVTLENRRVVLYDWLRLVNVGWAVFGDAGSVWGRGRSFDAADVQSDVGAGIRFAPSRSVDPGLIRIDIAYALNDNDQTSRFVLNIGADVHFGERRLRKFDQ